MTLRQSIVLSTIVVLVCAFEIVAKLKWLLPWRVVIFRAYSRPLIICLLFAVVDIAALLYWLGGNRSIGRKLAAQDRALLEGKLAIRLDDEK
jgi:hypothetical protein